MEILTTKTLLQKELFLDELDDIFDKTYHLANLKQIVVEKIGKFLNADRVDIAEFDTDREVFLPADEFSEYLSSPEIPSLIGTSPHMAGTNKVIEAYKKSREILYVSNTYDTSKEKHLNNPEVIKFLEYYKIRASIGSMIFKDDILIGIIGIHFTQAIEEATPEILKFLEKIFERVSKLFPSDNTGHNFVYINKYLAKTIGLDAAVTYNVLFNKYQNAVKFKILNSNKFLPITIKEINEKTYLQTQEQRLALGRLKEVSLIELANSSKNYDNFSFKIEDFVILDFDISQRQYQRILDYFKKENINADCNIQEMSKLFLKFFEEEYLKLTEYFFCKLEENKYYFSKINNKVYIFYSIYHILNTFSKGYNLDSDDIKSIINNLFPGKTSNTNNSNIVSLTKPGKSIANKLKLILLYKFKEVGFGSEGSDIDLFLLNN